MLDCKIEQTEDKKILIINSDLTIQNAAELKEVLIEALQDPKSLILNLENITDADLSGIQLIYSAYKTIAVSGNNITLKIKCADVFKNAVRDTGYRRHLGCESDCDDICED